MPRRENMTRFERKLAQREAAEKAEAAGEVADSMEVRKALMARFHSGEITLEQAQTELRRIQKSAKHRGLKTRDQFYR